MQTNLKEKLSPLKKAYQHHAHMSTLVRICMYVLLLDLVFVFLYPFLHMVITSFKSQADLNDISVKWLLNEIDLDNYRLAIKTLDYGRRLFNTSFTTILTLIGHVFSCAFIGYGFARYSFRFKNFWFCALLLAMVIPTQTIIIPVYMVFSKLGWAGTSLPIIIPTFFGFGLKGALFVFLFRQFFLSLPKSLEEAAQIDGCGAIKTFFKIAFPAARSSILVCIVLGMVWQWNEFFEASVYLTQQKDFFLSMMLPTLYNMIKSTAGDAMTNVGQTIDIYNEATVMAATTLTIVPIFIAYMFLQRKFMQGIETSGITGE